MTNSKQLQWGHDFSAVEMIYRPGGGGPSLMLQWGHDFSAVEIIREAVDIYYHINPASMGPRLFSRGNINEARILAQARAAKLQWGHDFSAVEIRPGSHRRLHSRRGFNGATTFQPWKLVWSRQLDHRKNASMGPRLFSRGNRVQARRCWVFWRASMGPRLFSRGNNVWDWEAVVTLAKLQWGHDFSAVEIL